MSQAQPELIADEQGLPKVTPAFLAWFFEKLGSMEVNLDENPLDYGPRRLNNKTAEARTFLTETEGLFLKVSHIIQKYRSAHRAASTALTLAKNHLFANDPETRAGRNQTTQDAIASVKLREEVENVDRLASCKEDLEALLVVIKSKRADLRDVQGRIRDQTKLCQEEIGLGGRWGSKPPPGSKAPDLEARDPEAKTLKELQEMFSEDETPPAESPQRTLDEVPAPAVFLPEGDEQSDSFLEAIGEAPKSTSSNLDDLLRDFGVA
jgi:hypothetical protein